MPRSSKPGASYPPDWPEISKRLKEEAGGLCQRCGRPEDPRPGQHLTIHHLDMDPSNNRWWNTAVLCCPCHLQIQHKVVMEQPWMFEHSEWFKPFVAGYYAEQFGFPDDRPFVESHVDELILLGQGRVDRHAVGWSGSCLTK